LPTTFPVGAESGRLEEYTVNNISLAQVARDCHFAEFQWNQDPDVASMVAFPSSSALVSVPEQGDLGDSSAATGGSDARYVASIW
jgi:hypothetical protein